MKEPVTIDEISKRMRVLKSQMQKWITKAVEEGKVEKQTRSVRYVSKREK